MSKTEPIDAFFQELEDQEIIKSSYINENISLQAFLVLRKLNMDRVKPNFLLGCAEHSELFGYYYMPVILYKLAAPVEVGEDITQDRFILECDNFHQFKIDIVDGETKQQESKRFYVSKAIYMVKGQNVADLGRLREYVDNPDYPENPLILYKDTKNYIAQYVDCDGWIRVGKTLWSFGTHVYEALPVYPYLDFLAIRGSGKTRALKTLCPICRNGALFLNPSSASIFRTVNALSPTLFIDQTEKLTERVNDPNTTDLINLLMAGYERGAKVPRVNTEKGYAIELFDAYCPKVLAGIKDIDPTLATRCLYLPIQRTLNPGKYAAREPDIDHGQELNQRLMFWAIDNGSELVKAYEADDLPDEYQQLLILATPRLRQLVKPLLHIALQIGIHNIEGEMELLRKFIEYQNQHATAESVDIADQRVFFAVYTILKEAVGSSERTIDITTKEIINQLDLENESEKKYYNPIRVGFILKRFHIPNSARNGRKHYFVNTAHLTELMQRYNITVGEGEGESNPSEEGQQSITEKD